MDPAVTPPARDGYVRPILPDDPPPGDHPLEIAARAGIGPLSPLGEQAWHGYTAPCVSCGQLVQRSAVACDHCGQDLSDDMLETMRRHAGPWYVLEHVRPFPGVKLERVIRQILRGVLTETSIIRGPATEYQWRFAGETPGFCRYFSRCWKCHRHVAQTELYCPACLSYLDFEKPRETAVVPQHDAPGGSNAPAQRRRHGGASDKAPPAPQQHAVSRTAHGATATARGTATPTVTTAPATAVPTPQGPGPSHAAPVAAEPVMAPPGTTIADIQEAETLIVQEAEAAELRALSSVLASAPLPVPDPRIDAPPRIAGIRATWVAAGMLVIAIVVLIVFSARRERVAMQPTASERVAPTATRDVE